MQNLTVTPATRIHGPDGAKISHGHSGTVIVTATNQDGDTCIFAVAANDSVPWYPPDGWTHVTFSASGFDDEARVIEWPAGAATAD